MQTGSEDKPVIRLEGIGKSFGPVRANHEISLSIHAGRILALLGENGAGKSTLMSILAGRLQPDSGSIAVDGETVRISSTQKAHALGIGMVYQHFMLVDAMTVTENVLLGQRTGLWLPLKKLQREIAALAGRYGLKIDPAARVADLSMGERQRVEILKLLYRRSRILIFDEPTTVLTPQESEQLFDALRQMAGQGQAILFISHKLDEVLQLADEIAILRKGRLTAQLPTRQVASKAELALQMVGREVLLDVARTPMEPRQVVLRAQELSGDGLRQIDLQVRQGEIVALVGVAGNGQKPLVESICGLRRPQSGSLTLLGQPWHDFYGRPRWDGHLSYIPEDRRGLATCLEMDLTDNFLLTTRQGFCRGPWLDRGRAQERAAALIQEFDVQPPDPDTQARRLSGGNLQKMVLAREFYRRPRLIVAEQPTQGLDIGAIEAVWQVLLKARARAGILLVTGDLTEALALSDRIAVIFEGRIMDTFDRDDREKLAHIGLLMAGVEEPLNEAASPNRKSGSDTP